MKKLPKKLVSYRIPEDLWRDMRDYGAETGISQTRFVENALRSHLDEVYPEQIS